MKKFRARYEVDDGYVVESRLISFTITEGEINDEMDEDDLEAVFDNAMECHFEQNIYPVEVNREEFVDWAKSIFEEQKND